MVLESSFGNVCRSPIDIGIKSQVLNMAYNPCRSSPYCISSLLSQERLLISRPSWGSGAEGWQGRVVMVMVVKSVSASPLPSIAS